MANLNKTALASASSSTFTDNTSGLITPALHRTYNTNTIDSFLTSKDASSLEAVMLENRSSSKAAANTVDLSTADGNLVHITTGTPDIAGFGTVQAGARFVLVFDVALTVLYNITSLILPTAANIVTAAGDTAFLISEGGGNWRCVAYQRASGAALVGGTGGAWGTITGTLSAQTDLQTALNTKVDGNTAITGATKTRITYDSKGLVTAGGDAAITELSDVAISSPANNEALVYDLASSKWKNKALTGSGTVTNIATDGLLSGGPITTSGTITTSINTNKIVGRSSASAGVMEEIAIGSGLTLSGGTLTNTATPTPLGYYAMYQDVNIQTAALVNTGYPMLFRTMDLSNQVTVVSNSQITFAFSGIYNLQFSAQFSNADTSSAQDVTIWLRRNGTNVIGSAGLVGIPKKTGGTNGHILPSWNYLLDVIGGDYYEIVWSTTSTDVQIQYYAGSNPPPSTASTIFTVTQQSGIMAGSGLTALNGLSAITQPVQLFAKGTDNIGNDWSIDSAGDTHTFNFIDASASTRGLLSSTKFTDFNNKYTLPSGGTTSQYIRGDGTLSSLPTEIQVAASDEVTALTSSATAKVTFRMPYAMTLTGIRASLTTAQASGSILTVDVNQNGTSILSPKLTFDNGEKTTVTAATQPSILTPALTDDAEITVDVDQIGASGATGLKITLIGTRA